MEKGADADGTIPMKTVMKKVQEWYVWLGIYMATFLLAQHWTLRHASESRFLCIHIFTNLSNSYQLAILNTITITMTLLNWIEIDIVPDTISSTGHWSTTKSLCGWEHPGNAQKETTLSSTSKLSTPMMSLPPMLTFQSKEMWISRLSYRFHLIFMSAIL